MDKIQGYIPIEIPVKPYVKAYVLNKLGPMPLLTNSGETIGKKLFDLLEHKTNEFRTRFKPGNYSERIRVYIPVYTYRKSVRNLN